MIYTTGSLRKGTRLCSKWLIDQSVDPLSDEGAGEASRLGQTVRP